jgi:hypothetical protein
MRYPSKNMSFCSWISHIFPYWTAIAWDLGYSVAVVNCLVPLLRQSTNENDVLQRCSGRIDWPTGPNRSLTWHQESFMSLSFFKSNWVTSLSSPCNHMISDSHSTAPAPLLNIHHHDLSSEKQTRANLVLLRTQKSHANIRIPSATVIEMPKHIPHWACVAKCRYLRPRCEPVLLDSGLLRKQLRPKCGASKSKDFAEVSLRYFFTSHELGHAPFPDALW